MTCLLLIVHFLSSMLYAIWTVLMIILCGKPLINYGWKKSQSVYNSKYVGFQAKPKWVTKEVIRLKAHIPNAGCRKIAHVFNRLYSYKGITVGKTYVNDVIRKYHYEILQKRKSMKTMKPRHVPPNLIWGCDLTGKTDTNGKLTMLFGIIEHHSRLNLSLVPLKSKQSIVLVQNLLMAIKKYGKPKIIRTDNESVFTSKLFQFALWILDIKHQRIDLAQPWQNGRIERFFGTLKESLNQWQVASFENLEKSLIQFRFWYNHVRPHQNLGGKTPAEMWNKVDVFSKKYKKKYWFEAWDGLLTGYYLQT